MRIVLWFLLLCSLGLLMAHGSSHHRTCTYVTTHVTVESSYNDNDVQLAQCENFNADYLAERRRVCLADAKCKVKLLQNEADDTRRDQIITNIFSGILAACFIALVWLFAFA